MNAIFKKLNFKAQPVIHILNAPVAFQPAMEEMKGLTTIQTDLGKAKDIAFTMIFATKQKEVDQFADRIAKQSIEDAVIWMVYPKGTSKKYTCEFNRDNGWKRLGEHDFEPVRMVAIDEDWSALRFRRAEKIKTMTRSRAISAAGEEKIKKTSKPD
ncbi:MAG: hypothetical protein NTW74_04445 [Acidobacteria bacterium]|nr:hypothetical protein [Acidobacteriota bacterium]